jgi:hypothetical protein
MAKRGGWQDLMPIDLAHHQTQRIKQSAVVGPRARDTRWESLPAALIGLALPGRPIGPWSRRTGAPGASATGRDRSPPVHGGVHVEPAGRGLQRARAVTTGVKEPQVRPAAQPPPGPLQKAGQSSSLPTRCREPSGSCPQAGGYRGRASPLGRAGSHRRQVGASSFSPAVPLACHSSGHERM